MARLPTPGSDNGTWGDVLNEYLSQSLKSDGAIKDNAVTSNTIAPNSVTNAAIATDAVNATSIADGSITNALLADGTIQEVKLSSAVQTKLNAGGGTPDWNTITNKPAVIAAGTDQAAARTAIGAGTSNLTLGTTNTTAKAGDYQPTAANISDSTATGRAVLTAADQAAARTAIGAGTSNLVLGTSNTTAKAGDYQPAAINISDSTATGRAVLTAADQAAARTAIGAGSSSLVIGTTSTTAKAGDYQPTAANISDSTAIGRSLITAADSAAARTAIGAGTSNLTIGTTGSTAKAGNYQPTAANISDSTATGRSLLTATDASAAKTVLTLTKSDVGLGNVDNTSDTAKNSAAVTLTNKTISGLSNTLTDIPASAIEGLSTDFSQLVSLTSPGATGAEDGGDTWAKIATFSTGTNQYAEAQILLSVTNRSSGEHDTAIISVYFRANMTGQNPVVDVKMVAKGGSGVAIRNDSFKVISGGWSTDMELWFKKGGTYGRFAFYETSKSLEGGTLTYTSNAAWQSATPTGAVNNVSSNGVESGLSLKIKGHVSVSDGIKDANGNPVLDLGNIPNAVNRIYIDNQSTGDYPTIGATGPDTNIGIALAPKNNGPVNLFGNAPTIAAAGGANGGNLNLNLKSQGTGVVQANGKPVTTSWMKYPFYSDPVRYEPWPQMLNFGGNWSLASGDVPLTLFIPAVNMTVSNIITMGWNDTTQTGATVCKVAIYRVDDVFSGGNKMECIARSGHKADRWNGSVLDTAPIVDNGAASPSPISSVTLTAGQEYAVGFISVGHTGTPKLSALGTFRKNTMLPHLGFFGDGGHTDMPVYINSGWLEEWTYVWFALS